MKKIYFFNDVAVAVPRHAAAAAEFQGLGTLGNSQPSRRVEKHLMLHCPQNKTLHNFYLIILN